MPVLRRPAPRRHAVAIPAHATVQRNLGAAERRTASPRVSDRLRQAVAIVAGPAAHWYTGDGSAAPGRRAGARLSAPEVAADERTVVGRPALVSAAGFRTTIAQTPR
ncbi:MAG: hypothetical protein KGS47_12520 [Chloroflexi bacterium]|nr:hypothetical protein [Chloroflexota bacterium]